MLQEDLLQKRIPSRFIVVILLGIAFITGSCSSFSYSHSACFSPGTVFPDYIQIREMQFAAGMTYFNAWRIHPDNSMEMASWNGNGDYLGNAIRKDGIPGLYSRLGDLSFTPVAESTEGDIVLGRPAYTITLSRTESGRTTSLLLEQPSPDLLQVIADLRSFAGKPHVPEAGNYLWVEPTQKPADPGVDLNDAGACENGRMKETAAAIVSGILMTGISPSQPDREVKKPAPEITVALKAGQGWYLSGKVRAPGSDTGSSDTK